jgi:RHS repeat-associated protein
MKPIDRRHRDQPHVMEKLRRLAHFAFGIAIACGSTAHAGDAAPPPSRVVEALVAGTDARAAVAQALAQNAPPPAKAAYDEGAVAGYVRRLARAGELAAAVQAGAAPDALRVALVDLAAQRLLVDARIAAIDTRAATLSPLAAQRWAEKKAALDATLSRIDAALETARRGLKSIKLAGQNAQLTELVDVAAANAAENRTPIYGANLPVHRPRLAAREPVVAPVVVPAYANAAAEVEPVGDDLADTDDAPLSAEIRAKAASLGHDYARIVDFVRSEVRTQWYAGAQKGANTTLRTMAGNDVDQASLLVALLRASLAPARYVEGVIEMPLAELATMLAVRPDKVGQALAAAGVAHRPVVRGGRIAAYAIAQVWVEAYLPLTNYRGTSADLDGKTWLPLAPALKRHRHVPAQGALALAGVSARAFADESIRTVQTQSPLELLRGTATQTLAQMSPARVYDELLARHELDAPPLEVLPTSLPGTSVAVTAEFARLPERLRQRLRIVVRGADDATLIDTTLPLADVAERRVTLAYEPASIEDGNIADRAGGMGQVPPALIEVRPVLHVAGMPVRHGTGALGYGAAHRVEVTAIGPAGDAATVTQDLVAGGMTSLVVDAQGDRPPQQSDDVVLPGESETDAARVLGNLGARYLATWDDADAELARLTGVGVVRPFPSLAFVVNRYTVARVGGVVDGMAWQGVALDAAMRPAEAFAGVADNRAEVDFTELSALEGSALEHRVFEQQWAVDSVSADKGLALAVAQNIPVLQLSAPSSVADLNQPVEVKNAIAAWLARGYVVDVPRDPLTLNAWTGAVWRVRALATGESGWFIAGNLAGGATTLPPALWYFQDLAELLGNAYGAPANEDPLAGALISVDVTSQDQDGEAGTTLATPLRVVVADERGRVVRGAEVTFVMRTGASTLLGTDTQGASVTVRTDQRGIAQVRLKLDTQLGDTGEYRVEPNMQHPQFFGAAFVDVSAAARHGRIGIGEPIRAWIRPGAPAKIAFGNTEPPKIEIGIGWRLMTVAVADRYDNPIANAPVTLNATTTYGELQCGDPPEPQHTIDASLSTLQQCPAGETILTGNACATPNLALASQSFGAPFILVPPNAAPATVRILATSGDATQSVEFASDDAYRLCSSSSTLVRSWVHSPRHGLVYSDYNFGGGSAVRDMIDAARPGELAPMPMRVDVWRGTHESWRVNVMRWEPVVGAQLAFHFGNGSGENARMEAPGRYLYDLRGGAQPGMITGYYTVAGGGVGPTVKVNASEDGGLNGWTVDPRRPSIVPSNIGLNAFSATENDVTITAAFAPENYLAAPLRIEILKNGEVLSECGNPLDTADFTCTIARGFVVEHGATYTARTVLNDGTPFRMVSESATFSFGQGIVAGYGLAPSRHGGTIPGGGTGGGTGGSGSGGNVAIAGFLSGKFPESISLNQDIDIPSGYVCATGSAFGFVLSQPAQVTLKFNLLGEDGKESPMSAYTPISGERRDAGLHEVAIEPSELGPGDYAYTLTAIADDGKKEEYKGRLSNNVDRRDSLPLAHSIVKGVDIYSGNATLTEDDIVLGGRGPGLRLVRTYASHQGGSDPGFVGSGWSIDLDNQVIATACDLRIMTGGAGQGQRFRPVGIEPDGARRFEALNGYHGVLVQRAGAYDYYAKDGTRLHFGQDDPTGPRLSYTEDTSGNRVVYTWEQNDGKPRVVRMADSAGRQIDLTYTRRIATVPVNGVPVEQHFMLLSGARGPDGLQVGYEYDANANLSKVTRVDGSGLAPRLSEYGYRDYGWQAVGLGDKLTYKRFGYRLIAARDGVSQGERTYDYELGWSVAGDWLEPEQRVKTLTEPDQGATQFAYRGLRGSGADNIETDVTDARAKLTNYRLNGYGATERETNPVGRTITEWNLAAMQPSRVTDALDTVTDYAYDGFGNKTRETITRDGTTRERVWTYKPASAFALPYVRNRADTHTDARDGVTAYGYDDRGNLTSVARGGIEETFGYAANGDRIRRTDGRNKTWTFSYDANGFPSDARDPLQNLVSTTYDARGRKTAQTDANRNTTTWVYDARDRVVRVTYPATDAGVAIENTTWNDVARTRRVVNARNVATVTTFDAMGRVLEESSPIGAIVNTYDRNGNVLSTTDRGNHATTFEYDDANRLVIKREPEGRTTTYDVDALGHVERETTGDRVTEYVYADPEYRRTKVRRKLVTDGGAAWVEEATRYDDNGNAIETIDGEGRTTTRDFDARDRLAVETAPLGRVVRYEYDGNDAVTVETRENPRGSGTQVRRNAYDDAGRLIATTDAESGTRSQTYDAAGNVVSRTNARGHATQLRYDARNNLVEEIGPEAGQRTLYGYDRRNNRTHETRSNGRALVYTYDTADRLTRTDDSDGLVEERSLDGDGLVTQQRDADNRITTMTYDGLHNPRTKNLPGGTSQRTITTHYSIHGELESETDPRDNTTTHDYDTLGRRVRTTAPEVDGTSATRLVAYDKVGNVVAETNARIQTTTYTVNALNQRTSQIDPATPDGGYEQHWTYDAIGNALTHTDRRGVLSVTAYDKENRAIGHARDGRILDTLTLDAEGNVTMLRDALGRETHTVYDRANRKTREVRPLGAISTWTYTPEGDIATATDADNRTTSYTYTKRRQLETQTLAAETTTSTYNGSGQLVTRERPNGKTWTYAYDSAGRLASIEDPLEHVTTFGYDAANNRTTVKDANDRTTTFAYDARNRLSGKTYPGGAAYVWRYDGDGNQTNIETPNGREITTTYDALNRALTTTYAGAGANEASQTMRHYDGNANVVSVEETIGGDTRTESRRYDAFDRVEHVADVNGRTVNYRYDAVGNRTHLVDHDGAETVWGYDDLNRNVAIAVPGQGTTTQTHTKAGKLASIVRPDGSTSEYAYDEAGRIESIAHAKAGETIASYAYRYDLNGNRVEQKETNGPTTNGTATTTYRYDEADRLDRVIEPERTSDYTLDPVGNRTLELVTANGNTVSRSVLGYNARDQLTSRADAVANVNVVQTYDDSGNLKTQTSNGTTRTYDYDARDRMLRLQEGTNEALTFDYDAQGMRLKKSQGAQTTKYQYDQASLLAETNAIGNTLSRYHYSATQLIGETKAGTTPVQRHYLLDALRSPIALLTQQGTVSARTRYDAWGEVIAQQGAGGAVVTSLRDAANAELPEGDEQPVGFTGYIKDSESGLYYAKARYYDPAVARFTTEDPEAGKDMESPSLHRYLYAYANPTVYIDLDGRQACRGHVVDNCPLEQWTSPNRPIPQTIANDALRGEPQLTEVDADRAFALPSASVAPDQHINTELYRLVPNVDPDGDGKAVRFYSAQNRKTEQFDWSVPPGSLDHFVANESFLMNTAVYSRMMGGTTPSNIAVQRMLRDASNGDLGGATSNFASSWAAAGKDPLFYLNLAGSVTAGSAAKAVAQSRSLVVSEGASVVPAVRLAPESAAAMSHPGKLAAESSSVTKESIMRALRQSKSLEGNATAKLIKRGIVDMRLVPTDPWRQGAAGRAPFGTNQAILALDKIPNAKSAAGFAAHETRHVLQKLTPRTYRRVHELEAYQWQRAVDSSFGLSDAQILSWLAREPLYKNVPPSMVIDDVAN